MIAEMYEDFSRVVHHKSALEKSLNDYQQKRKQPKLLLSASFLHTKNISFLIFIQLKTSSSPDLFS